MTGIFYNGTLFLKGEFFDNQAGKSYYTAKIKVFDPEEVKALENEKFYKLQMGNLAVDPEYSDIHFKVQDQHFSGHKAVLSARCQFFKNMFESGMSESTSSQIVVEDVDPSLFKAVLQFIYSNKVDLTQDLACDLLKLADKWSFVPLKEYCEIFLSNHLTQENFKDIAAITKYIETPELENALVEFVVKNFKATQQRGSLSGLPQNLYMNIIAKILHVEYKS